MNKNMFAFSKIILMIFILCFASKVLSSQPKTYNKLAVVITAKGDSIKIKGYIIYVKDGKEIKMEIEKDNAWGWNFKGDYIKEVKVQKISGDASYHLFVIENNNFLFESKEIKSNNPIVYKNE